MAVSQETINTGLFIPTTNVWDVQELYDIEVTSPEFKELLVRLYQNINNISMATNLKESAYYELQEFVNGQLYFPDPALSSVTANSQEPEYRQVYRTTINFGALPNTGTKSVAHNIDVPAAMSVTHLYAAATDPTGGSQSFIPIPFASPVLADNISLEADDTNVTITTGSNRSNYTICYVVIEYLKQ